jgi:hypothetical protein
VAHLDVQVRRAGAALATPGDARAGGERESSDGWPEVDLVLPRRALRRVHVRGELGRERVEVAEHEQPAVARAQVERAPIADPRRAHALDERVGRREHVRARLLPGREIEPGVEVVRAWFAEPTAHDVGLERQRPMERFAERIGPGPPRRPT